MGELTSIIRSDGTAIWGPHHKYKTYRECTNYHYEHNCSKGALPEVCPGCGAKMIKGQTTKTYLDIAKALQEDNGGDVFFF